MPRTKSNTELLTDIQKELSVNTTETKNIVERLDKLNGSVAKHDTQIALNSQAIALVTQTMTTMQATAKTSSDERTDWTTWLIRGLIVIGLILFYNILIHVGIVQQLTH